MTPPFLASRLKIDRAAKHIEQLEKEFYAFTERGPMMVIPAIETRDGQEWYGYTFRIRELVPPELSTVIGDAIHNLRSSLDLLVSELVRLGGGDDNSAYFPFAQTPKELEEKLAKSPLNKIAQEFAQLIKEFQQHGNLAFYGVHQLDIIDKHRTILPVANEIWGYRMALSYQSIAHISIGDVAAGWMLRENAPDAPTRPYPASFKLFFPDGGPFAGLEMLPTLYRLLHYFSRVIEAFQALALENAPDPKAIKF